MELSLGTLLRVVLAPAAIVMMSAALPDGPAVAAATRVTPRAQPPVSGADPAPGLGLSGAVSGVPATSNDLDDAELARDRLIAERSADTDELARTMAELAVVDSERTSVGQLLGRRDGQIVKAAKAEAELSEDLRSVAVEWFITGFDVTKTLDPTLSAAQREQLERGRVLSGAAAEDTIGDQRRAASRLTVLRSERRSLSDRQGVLDARSGELATRSRRLNGELLAADASLADNSNQIAEARMTATIDGTDMSTGALDAYWRAAQQLAVVDPGCRVAWWALAGIGRTESRHGTYRGASVARDGTVAPPIYGPELDGSNTFAVVPDSDGGRLDATSATDRAVGPMQFLPSTWKVVGRDGSGDGVLDPQNLYDAALSAGVYLCRSGPDLSQDGRLRSAYFSYNRSREYVEVVLGYAKGYQSAVALPG